MGRFTFLFASLLVISLSSCFGPRRDIDLGYKWLDSHKGASSLNIAGTWHSDVWGTIKIRQKGQKFLAYSGSYTIKGYTNGNKVFLIFTEHPYVYYFAILEYEEKGRLWGEYFRPEGKAKWEMNLKRQ